MALQQTLEIRRSSAAVLGSLSTLRPLSTVSKYIDTTTCIGCKACEAACVEWNDTGRVETQQTGSYQTLPTLHAQLWNLIRFDEREFDGGIAWLMRKDQCMHCDEPGCLAACPAPGAIVQYTNGIVDVNPDQCIGCGYCETGCPFDVPRFHRTTGKMAKCTLCVDRVAVGLEPACIKACPTGCLQFGTKDDMLALARGRLEHLKKDGYADAAIYDPRGVNGTSVITLLAHGNHPEWYGLPADPHVPLAVKIWKRILRPLGAAAVFGALLTIFGHYTKYGAKRAAGDADETGNFPSV
jgi:formate dehydrogenase beta subunit